MKNPIFLHWTDSVALQPPGLVSPLAIAGLGLVLTGAFGSMAYYAISAAYPAWLEAVPFLPLSTPHFRTLMAIVGGFNCVAGLSVTGGYLARAWAILGHRIGLHPVMQSQGSCRLIQEEPSIWGLQLSVTDGDDPGYAWALTSRRTKEQTCEIFFHLDEAAAGTISRLFNPGEVLTLRWLDLPLSAGGPTLLEVRTPAREVATGDCPVDTSATRAA